MMNKKAQGGMGQTLLVLSIVVLLFLGIYFLSKNMFGTTGKNVENMLSCGGIGVGEGECKESCDDDESSFKGYGCPPKDAEEDDLNKKVCCIKLET